MKRVIATTLHSTFTECTGKQTQFETQCIDMLLLCPAIPVISPPFQIKKINKKIQPASWKLLWLFNFSGFSLAAHDGRTREERRRKAEEKSRISKGWGSQECVCMCVCARACVHFCAYVCGCSKSINVWKCTKSIPEPISEPQIHFPGPLPSFSWECCDSQSDCMD